MLTRKSLGGYWSSATLARRSRKYITTCFFLSGVCLWILNSSDLGAIMPLGSMASLRFEKPFLSAESASRTGQAVSNWKDVDLAPPVSMEDFFRYVSNFKPFSDSLQKNGDAEAKAYKEHPEEFEYGRVNVTTLSFLETFASHAAHNQFIAGMAKFVPLVSYRVQSGSRGIVTIGGGKHSSIVSASLKMLRKTGSNIPVEVFLPTEDEYDEYLCSEVLPDLGARCVVFPKVEHFKLEKFQFKAMALLLSEYEHVLFMDSDNFAIKDPETLFDHEPYNSTGMVTWPDFWTSSASQVFYDITTNADDGNNKTWPLGRGGPGLSTQASTESGQILLNKREHATTLLLIFYYNVWGPLLFYRILTQGTHGEGDKETFAAAACVLGKAHFQVRRPPGIIGYMPKEADEFRGIAVIQHDLMQDWKARQGQTHNSGLTTDTMTPQPFFIHQSLAKLDPATVLDALGGFSPAEDEQDNDATSEEGHGGDREDPDGIKNETDYHEGNRADRMWGSKRDTMEKFGHDLEAQLWQTVEELACDEAYVLKGWEGTREEKEWEAAGSPEAQREVRIKSSEKAAARRRDCKKLRRFLQERILADE